jgi:hypothetical protein
VTRSIKIGASSDRVLDEVIQRHRKA